MNIALSESVRRQVRLLGELRCRCPATVCDAPDIRRALRHPLWESPGRPAGAPDPVFDRIRPGESVGIVVSDHTRKTAVDRVLPLLVEGLLAGGVAADDVFVLVASGIHRKPTDCELETILGPAMARTFAGRIRIHDPDDDRNLAVVGTTRRGHRVRLNRLAVDARRLILTGAVVHHYHAGFGGGRKSLVPGLAARDTIAHNHSLTIDPAADRFHPGAEAGRLEGNPVAETMLEAARFRRPDFIVNTVLTPDGEIAGVFAGDMEPAHAAACAFADRLYRCDIAERADLAIASAGSALNWIQSHKALVNADRAVRAEGRIVLLAPCPEGLGNERFRHWVRQPTVADLFAGLRIQPEILGQTALSTRLRAPRTILVTRMPDADARDLGMRTAPDTEAAVQLALADIGTHRGTPTAYLMPEAALTMPTAVA